MHIITNSLNSKDLNNLTCTNNSSKLLLQGRVDILRRLLHWNFFKADRLLTLPYKLLLENTKINDAWLIVFSDALCKRAMTKLQILNLGNNRIGDNGLIFMSARLAGGTMENLTILDLNVNQIGDKGVSALLTACADGALPKLKELYLNDNNFGAKGMEAFAEVSKEAMAQLQVLRIGGNPIGDNGLTSLAKALHNGALPQLQVLYLNNNNIGDPGVQALANACAEMGALSQLKQLFFNKNRISDSGVYALKRACADGALSNLEKLNLSINNITGPTIHTYSSLIAN